MRQSSDAIFVMYSNNVTLIRSWTSKLELQICNKVSALLVSFSNNEAYYGSLAVSHSVVQEMQLSTKQQY